MASSATLFRAQQHTCIAAVRALRQPIRTKTFQQIQSRRGHCAAVLPGSSAAKQAMAQQEATKATDGPRLKTVLVVGVALIDQQQQVLLAQRPAGKPMAGLWEFPGGKVEAGEIPEMALVRELQEELNIQVQASDLEPLTFASHSYETFHLLMPLYVCRHWRGELHGVEGQQLVWVPAQQLHKYAMPAADVPLVEPVLRAMAATANGS